MSSFTRPLPVDRAEYARRPSAEEAADALHWLRASQRADLLHVRRVPLHQLADWSFDPETGNLGHRTGRFFSIHGVRVSTTFGAHDAWMQPLIAQPEVGILGFLAARRGGELWFLAQAKIEPGNVNVAQVSPTVQATRSNYTRVHGGASQPYLEYFLGPPPGDVLVDQLQQEQGSRFRAKRNRNTIIEVDPRHIPVLPGYRWVSSRELAALAEIPNALNLDARSVLSCLPAPADRMPASDDAPFTARVRTSLSARDERSRLDARRWLAGLARRFQMTTEELPLRCVAGWSYDGGIIAHERGRYFEIVGVSVDAPTREVPHWDQPLVRSVGRGVVGMLCQQRGGLLRFLVRAALEPGEPHLRIGPTVQCVPGDHDAAPPFLDAIVQAPGARVRFASIQSEEGGRFYHDERVLRVVEAAAGEPIDVPPEYMWLTLGDITSLAAADAVVNIEARSLIACISLTG